MYMESYNLGPFASGFVSVFLRFTHVVAGINRSSLSCGSLVVHCVDTARFVYCSLVDRHLSWFYLLAVVNSAAVNIHVLGRIGLSTCFHVFKVKLCFLLNYLSDCDYFPFSQAVPMSYGLSALLQPTLYTTALHPCKNADLFVPSVNFRISHRRRNKLPSGQTELCMVRL